MKTEPRFLNDLYIIKTSHSVSVNKLTVQIEINSGHQIFKGHFPGNPVLPGAATLQILKEVVAEHIGHQIILSRAANIKYLSFINPDKIKIIDLDIDLNKSGTELLSCNAIFHCKDTIFCSFKGEFKTTKY